MPIHAFAFEVKELTAKGQFKGLASTYGNVDQAEDVVMPGAFTRTLSTGKSRPLLWQHSQPIGLVDLDDSVDGLIAVGQLSMAIQQAKDAYELMKDGVVRGLSIGFQAIKQEFQGDTRQLIEIKLLEVSLVTLPCNERATVTGLKSAQNGKIQLALKGFRSEILAALKG